jgi:hypothetical protein
MNKKTLLYLGLASTTLLLAFVYIKSQAHSAQAPLQTSKTKATLIEKAQALPSAVVQMGQLTTKLLRLEAKAGEKIQLLIQSDIDDELRISDSDTSIPIPAMKTTRVQIPTSSPGSFALELHKSRVPIGVVDVLPSQVQ